MRRSPNIRDASLCFLPCAGALGAGTVLIIVLAGPSPIVLVGSSPLAGGGHDRHPSVWPSLPVDDNGIITPPQGQREVIPVSSYHAIIISSGGQYRASRRNR